jgi:hypothetical protein
VSSTPAGIACPTTCSASFDTGTNVTLTAAPAAGGWTFERLVGSVHRHRDVIGDRRLPGGQDSQGGIQPAAAASRRRLQQLRAGQRRARSVSRQFRQRSVDAGRDGNADIQSPWFSITFSASFGKIIIVYSAANVGGTLTISNSCPDGAPRLNTGNGLRAVMSGWPT